MQAVESVGLPVDGETLRRYGGAALDVARGEIAPILEGTIADPITYAVLGTALYEPVLLALRRLAHLHLLRHGEASATPAAASDQK